MTFNQLTKTLTTVGLGSVRLPRGLRRAAPAHLIAAALALACAGSAQAIIIDSFVTDQSLTLAYPPIGTSMSSSASGTGILGGERDLTINLTGGRMVGNGISSVVNSGYYSYSQDATIKGTGVIQWDGADASPNLNPIGLGGINLTAGGIDSLVLGVISDDLPVDVTITVYSSAGNASSRTLTLPGQIDEETAKTYFFKYSDFSTLLGSGADFANVGAITLSTGSSTSAPDLVFDFLETSEPPAVPPSGTVPEPGTLGLLGLGAAACGLVARRRKPVASR